MEKLTAAQWIRENYNKYGRGFVINGRLLCRDEVGHEYNEQNWNRAVRRVINNINDDCEDIPAESYTVKTLDDALKYHDVDESNFGIKKLYFNTWGSEGNQNQQVKVELEKKAFEFDINKWVTAFEAASNTPPVKAKERKINQGKLTAEISVPDMHIGQLIWKDSIGERGSNYTPTIAAELYVTAVKSLVAGLEFDKIKSFILPFGEDFFNVDNELNTTTKGTPQVNADPHEMVTLGLAAVFQVIDFLSEKGNVHIPIVPGNHDSMLSFMAGACIKQRYRNNKRVTVDNTPCPTKVYHSGKWAVMWVHGQGKPADIMWQFPGEYPDVWAKTKYREIHSGHIHHKVHFEDQAVALLFLSSLCPKDAWHNKKLYNAVREASLFLWHDEYGKISSRHYHPY